jgi:DNA invertase Pin-like site-specific DNA recombinase
MPRTFAAQRRGTKSQKVKIGYARVSTQDQKLELQPRSLKKPDARKPSAKRFQDSIGSDRNFSGSDMLSS